MLRENAEIISNDNIGAELFSMRVKSSAIARNWRPGQFVHILPPVNTGKPPMLRRPISILASQNDEFEFIYRVAGEGTSLISQMKPSDTLDIIGPLGNGFDNIPDSQGLHILIGGGVGAPPMIALARLLHEKKLDVEFYQGAKDASDLILNNEMENSEFKYHVTTEDGSIGHKGLVIDILPENTKQIAAVYACGPIGMMKAILKWRDNAGFPYFVSIENKMACGIGVCLGCSAPTVDGKYIRTCIDGPVFNADILDWEKI
ncbi:dihydroorotate dehydrogenase electron transfer subunit [bacterium]|nr:dihydroorotate dehydrogenase electron transfer subunit [bacterium]